MARAHPAPQQHLPGRYASESSAVKASESRSASIFKNRSPSDSVVVPTVGTTTSGDLQDTQGTSPALQRCMQRSMFQPADRSTDNAGCDSPACNSAASSPMPTTVRQPGCLCPKLLLTLFLSYLHKGLTDGSTGEYWHKERKCNELPQR